MKRTHDLSACDWTLTGWHPEHWRGTVAPESGMRLAPDIPAISAPVPGSVQQALLQAGLLPDWHEGLNARQCEWVENRHWVYETDLPALQAPPGGRVALHAQGLDYQGEVFLNGKPVGTFQGSHRDWAFDLTGALAPEGNRLAIAFTGNPRYLGQIGYTSQVREWKARYNYGWDWVARLVQVGIWDRLAVEIFPADHLDEVRAWTEYDHTAGRGAVTVCARVRAHAGETVEVAVLGWEGAATARFPATPEVEARLENIPAAAWQPNGNGEQPLYALRVRLLGRHDEVLDEDTRPIGFRNIVWRPCAGAPADALPWVCEVNGIPTFLQGANWVPLHANFADDTTEDIRRRLETYRDLGCNLLRVWGGSVLEREAFYQACDEYGLLVWQEFPLSSSGLDNWPPEDEASVREMARIVESYVSRRQHHPSLLMWCGGNELLGGPDGSKVGMDRPLDASHPMLAAQEAVVARLDPTRRFLPCSPFGPRTWVGDDSRGRGLHHDVHGPWKWDGDLAGWREYWDRDDALFHSEIGMPGAQPAALTRRYGDKWALPGDPANPWWTQTGGWWIQWPDYLAAGGNPQSLEDFVTWSQGRQAEALEYAARVCKRRFPACGGFVLWMGHDCWPCPVNTAIIDFAGTPKPAALTLARVWGGRLGEETKE